MCFFFNDTATTEIYTLSLHDALPIYLADGGVGGGDGGDLGDLAPVLDLLGLVLDGLDRSLDRLVDALLQRHRVGDRKSTRLNSSHANILYAVFCLKKKIAGTSLSDTA